MVCSSISTFAIGEILVVSSTSRPTGVDLYAGRRIYEADTGRELLYDGTGWVIMSEPAQTYAPTLTGFTGAATLATYRRHDGYYDLDLLITLSSAVSALMGISLPIAVPYATDSTCVGGFHLRDPGVASYRGTALVGTSTRLDVYAHATGSTYETLIATAATVPLTWASGDIVSVQTSLRMASRYS